MARADQPLIRQSAREPSAKESGHVDGIESAFLAAGSSLARISGLDFRYLITRKTNHSSNKNETCWITLLDFTCHEIGFINRLCIVIKNRPASRYVT